MGDKLGRIVIVKKKSSLIIIFSLFIILVTLLACEENKKGNMEMGNKNHINANQWKILEKKRIVFGHQSVGNNILTGVQDLAKQEKISLHVNELGVIWGRTRRSSQHSREPKKRPACSHSSQCGLVP